jgi:hypothetical protein
VSHKATHPSKANPRSTGSFHSGLAGKGRPRSFERGREFLANAFLGGKFKWEAIDQRETGRATKGELGFPSKRRMQRGLE